MVFWSACILYVYCILTIYLYTYYYKQQFGIRTTYFNDIQRIKSRFLVIIKKKLITLNTDHDKFKNTVSI